MICDERKVHTVVKPDLLRSFVAVAESRSFTAAALRLGLRQSTVSQHVARLEAELGRKLLARDTHAVAPTPDGQALIDFARQVLDANERMRRFLSGSEPRGRIRFGASEDFALIGLESVLTEFATRHPAVDIELTVGLSGLLHQKYDAGELDVILAKRLRDDDRGHTAWRERLVWIGRPGTRPDADIPLPLLLYPPPSISRLLAIETLERAGRNWRVACTSGSLSGLLAAARAGLGLIAHSARLMPQGLAVLPASRHLPVLPEIEFAVIGQGGRDGIGAALIGLILEQAGRLRQVN